MVLADLITRRAKDPGLEGALFSFLSIDVSPDLAQAKVRVSVMGDDDQKRDVIEALERSAPFLHREATKQLHIRRVPRLIFILDESIEEGDRMTQRLREVARSEGREL